MLPTEEDEEVYKKIIIPLLGSLLAISSVLFIFFILAIIYIMGDPPPSDFTDCLNAFSDEFWSLEKSIE